MEIKETKDKTASELNREILDLDVKTIDLKTVISDNYEDLKAIENNKTVMVRGDKELFKNETDRKIEIEKQLAGNITHKSLKEQIDTLNIQKLSQEVRKSFLERQLRIILNENPETLKRLNEVSNKIVELEREEIILVEESKKITEIKAERIKEINKTLDKKVFKNDEEKGKESVERILKDEVMKTNVNRELEIKRRLEQLVIDKEFLKRAIIIQGIVRGLRI